MQDRTRIFDTILDAIGSTPLVRINRLNQGDCELVAKCEYFNAGGSVKDRIGKRMVEGGEKSGVVVEGTCLIEPTSGNTGECEVWAVIQRITASRPDVVRQDLTKQL
jgi:cystathionine beta-synthase